MKSFRGGVDVWNDLFLGLPKVKTDLIVSVPINVIFRYSDFSGSAIYGII